ncbi:10523_t:CDS:2 [Acaulospora colombiana]|uniref:10523_t:CDS:1 n=1 Tax=Acaulospora colombiana TaxID=27376 RepID=A0ACA9L7M3_9GLOM|nr:10523_t:CDS:2 [Acaulospora colombiana]
MKLLLKNYEIASVLPSLVLALEIVLSKFVDSHVREFFQSHIAPDLAILPHFAYVPPPPVPYPDPPPSDIRGNPYARIICEVAVAQSSKNLNIKCRRWKREEYVQDVLGIKLYDVKTTRNNPQGMLDRAMKFSILGYALAVRGRKAKGKVYLLKELPTACDAQSAFYITVEIWNRAKRRVSFWP